MKKLLLLLMAMALMGCGKNEPKLRTEDVITPGEAANKLFVEAVELVNQAKSNENQDIPAAFKAYEEALSKVDKIVSEYKESDIAVKLVSGETLFKGKSLDEIKETVSNLKHLASSADLLKRIYSLAQKKDYEKLKEECIFPFSEFSLPDLLLRGIMAERIKGGDGAYSHKALKTLIDNHLGELKPASGEALRMCTPDGGFGEDLRVVNIAKTRPKDITMFDFKRVYILIIKFEDQHKLLFWENLTELSSEHQETEHHLTPQKK